MIRKQKSIGIRLFKVTLAITLLGLLLAVTPLNRAGSQAVILAEDYTLPHYSMAAGGGWAAGGGYSLGGIPGSHDGGFAAGGSYELAGGVISRLDESKVKIFLPVIWR